MFEKINGLMSDVSGMAQYNLTKLRIAADKAALEMGSNLHLRKTEFGIMIRSIVPKKKGKQEERNDPEPSVRIKVTKKEE